MAKTLISTSSELDELLEKKYGERLNTHQHLCLVDIGQIY